MAQVFSHFCSGRHSVNNHITFRNILTYFHTNTHQHFFPLPPSIPPRSQQHKPELHRQHRQQCVCAVCLETKLIWINTSPVDSHRQTLSPSGEKSCFLQMVLVIKDTLAMKIILRCFAFLRIKYLQRRHLPLNFAPLALLRTSQVLWIKRLHSIRMKHCCHCDHIVVITAADSSVNIYCANVSISWKIAMWCVSVCTRKLQRMRLYTDDFLIFCMLRQ